MSRITPISWSKFEHFLTSVGCQFVREKGDHRIYARPGLLRPIVIPVSHELAVFVILNNLRVLHISHDEYLAALEKL